MLYKLSLMIGLWIGPLYSFANILETSNPICTQYVRQYGYAGSSPFPENVSNNCPSLQSLKDWNAIVTGSQKSFHKIKIFIEKHSNWPDRISVIGKAEQMLIRDASLSLEFGWFERYAPKTYQGILKYVEYLERQNKITLARFFAQKFWRKTPMTQRQQKAFLQKNKKYLTHSDHLKRLSFMALHKNSTAIGNLLPLLHKDEKYLGLALKGLLTFAPNIDALVQNVPNSLSMYPALLFLRVWWRWEKGKKEQAISLFLDIKRKEYHQPILKNWGALRLKMGRNLLMEKKYQKAFQVLSEKRIMSSLEATDSAFLSGWLTLHKLNRPREAFDFFKKMQRATTTPISQAKAYYWMAKACQALGDFTVAQEYFEESAQFFTTYYGQLSQKALQKSFQSYWSMNPRIRSIRKDYSVSEQLNPLLTIIQYGKYIHRKQDKEILQKFVRHTAQYIETSQDAAYFLEMVDVVCKEELIYVSKVLGRKGYIFVSKSYPCPKNIIERLQKYKTILPVVLALIRQESGFNHKAMSSAGAVGLMQLLPRVANMLSKKQKITWSIKALFNPQNNVDLGMQLLDSLRYHYQDNFILILADYNAGRSRVKEWIRKLGDPRQMTLDQQTQWIETIPFEETRSYIQRVLEAVPIYQQILGIK